MQALTRMTKTSSFKSEYSLEARKKEYKRIQGQYPDRIPVICERARNSAIPDIDKKKYLIPADFTVGHLMFTIRKRINLPSEQALFLFIHGRIPANGVLLSSLL